MRKHDNEPGSLGLGQWWLAGTLALLEATTCRAEALIAAVASSAVWGLWMRSRKEMNMTCGTNLSVRVAC
jgi:hypothetical protein